MSTRRRLILLSNTIKKIPAQFADIVQYRDDDDDDLLESYG